MNGDIAFDFVTHVKGWQAVGHSNKSVSLVSYAYVNFQWTDRCKLLEGS